MALISKLTAIAEAIRNKTGKTDLLTLEQMPVEIAAIETGGGSSEGGDTGVEDALIQRANTLTEYSNDRVTEVGQYALAILSYLRNVDLPNVTKVNDYAFYQDYYLTNVNLPNATWIGYSAFYNCDSALKSLILPKAEVIGNSAFSYCETVEKIILPKVTGDITLNTFAYCKALTEIILPFVTTMTGRLIFRDCAALKTVILPSVTELGYSSYNGAIFHACTALEALILPGDTVCTLKYTEGTFGRASTSGACSIVEGTGYIYVPKAKLSTYKAATNWTTYSAQFRAIEDYPEICAAVLNADGTIKTAEEISAEMEASI